jgi:hypothetical protein
MNPGSNPPLRPPLFGAAELRILLALMQALAIGLTWQLWQVRTVAGDAPNLPVFDARWVQHVQFGFGWLLLASLVLAVVRPKIGIPLHCGLLVLAIGLDQLRIQPEFVSVAILLVGTLPSSGPKRLARCHLIALWFWAGLHKLLSAGYLLDSGPRMWTDTLGELPRGLAVGLAVAAAVFELLLGIAAMIPRARRFVPWLAALLHAGILLSLIVQGWNPAVWPWNVAIVAAAAELFGRREKAADREQETGDRGQWSKWAWTAAAVIALLHPGLYYVGLADAYLSWCVYSSNTPAATLYPAGADSRVDDAIAGNSKLDPATLDEVLEIAEGDELQFKHYDALQVPLSPAPRLFEQYFRRVGQPGEMLVVDDPRRVSAWRQRKRVVMVMTQGGEVVRW